MYFYISDYSLPDDPPKHEALDLALNTLAGLETGHMQRVIDAHDALERAACSWIDEELDEDDDVLPEEVPEYRAFYAAEQRTLAERYGVTLAQMEHAEMLADYTRGFDEVRERNGMYWSIREAQSSTVNG